MLDIIMLLVLLSSSSSSLFPLILQISGSNSSDFEPLDVILHQHALKAMLSKHQRPETGALYKVINLPAYLSGMEVSYIRLRSKTLWTEGANFSNILIPPRTLPIPYVKRVVVLYQDFGNLSSRFYNKTVPGYSLVSSVVGFTVYDASNLDARIVRKLDFNITDETEISVGFPNLKKLPRGAKCASFRGSTREVVLGEYSSAGNHVCYSSSYGRFWMVVPSSKRKREEIRGNWVRWGIGFLMIVLVSFVGLLLLKIMKAKRMNEMEREADRSVDLETMWIGYSKMPCAAVTRTHPVLENAAIPECKTTII